MIKPDDKKVSTEFLNYLKNTPSMSQSKPQSFKQKQTNIEHSRKHETYHGPIEGDFSKIGMTYVLENDKLKKKDPVYRKPGTIQVHNQKYDELEQPQNIPQDVQLIKEITKLEFLEEKGYLKPQEIQRLQYLRGMKVAPQFDEPVEISEKKHIKKAQIKQIPPHQQIPFKIDYENMDPNMYYQDPYMSPKTKFGEPMYGYPQFKHPMDYNQSMNSPQKPQFFEQNHPMNYGPAMQPHQFDPRQAGYY